MKIYLFVSTDTYVKPQMSLQRPVHILNAHFYLIIFLKILPSIYILEKYDFFSLSMGPHILYAFNWDILLQYIYIYIQMEMNRLSLYIEHDKFWLLFEILWYYNVPFCKLLTVTNFSAVHADLKLISLTYLLFLWTVAEWPDCLWFSFTKTAFSFWAVNWLTFSFPLLKGLNCPS